MESFYKRASGNGKPQAIKKATLAGGTMLTVSHTSGHRQMLKSSVFSDWHAHHNLINRTKIINQTIAYGESFRLSFSAFVFGHRFRPSGASRRLLADCCSLQVN